MKITKLGHCCLIVEDAEARIMTDPGAWTPLEATGTAMPLAGLRAEAKHIDYIFITHEHQDHLHVESLKAVLKHSPKAKVITNAGVGKILEKEKIPFELLPHGSAMDCGGVHAEGHGEKHAEIYGDYGQVENTGYFFSRRFFYPGDAFFDPQKPVEILALPVCGPWMKISEAIDYAKALKPKVAFPVHDGMLKILGPFHGIPQKMLRDAGIDFRPATEGTTLEL